MRGLGKLFGKMAGGYFAGKIQKDLTDFREDVYFKSWDKSQREDWLLKTAFLDPVQPGWVRRQREKLYKEGKL